jgi:predicted RNA-binding protein YlxR (DUF448 family)
MNPPKHVPQRTCVACGAKREQAQLIRIVQGPEAALSIGASGRVPGRGAYVCPRRQCWEKGLKGTRLEHALRAKLTNENRAALLQYSSTLEDIDSNG